MSQPQPKAQNSKNPKPKRNNKNKTKKAKQPRQQVLTLNVSNAPAATGTSAKTRAPRWIPMPNGKVRVAHSELVGSISGTDDFTVQGFPLNPGLLAPFLWLSSIAQNYESYKFHKLRAIFAPACPSTVGGSIYLTIDFDPQDAAPQTEAQIASYYDTASDLPWRKIHYGASSSDLSKQKTYLVRDTNTATPSNLASFDTGNLFIATIGNGSAGVLGKLWIEYEVEFMTPQFTLTAAGRSLSGRVNANDNFSTAPTVNGNLPIDFSIAGNILTLKSRQAYSALIVFNVVGTGLTSAATTGPLTARASVTTAAAFVNSYTLNFTGPNQLATFQITTPTTVTSYAFRIGQYNNANA